MLWAPSFQGPRSPSLLFRAEDLFFPFACRFFSPRGGCRIYQTGGGGGGGRRSKHWPPGAGDPRYTTGLHSTIKKKGSSAVGPRGSNFGPNQANVRKPTTWAKHRGGGSGPTGPPSWIRPWIILSFLSFE